MWYLQICRWSTMNFSAFSITLECEAEIAGSLSPFTRCLYASVPIKYGDVISCRLETLAGGRYEVEVTPVTIFGYGDFGRRIIDVRSRSKYLLVLIKTRYFSNFSTRCEKQLVNCISVVISIASFLMSWKRGGAITTYKSVITFQVTSILTTVDKCNQIILNMDCKQTCMLWFKITKFLLLVAKM